MNLGVLICDFLSIFYYGYLGSIGCKVNYDWCDSTPSVNVWVYNVAQALCMGFGMPLMLINLDIIFSKLLGPIRQGTMQGVFMVCGEVLNIAGPVLMSYVQHTHPTLPFLETCIWRLVLNTFG